MKKTKQQILKSYVVSGVPSSLISLMCKEMRISEKKLNKWLNGQTMALIGNETVIYTYDLERYLNKYEK